MPWPIAAVVLFGVLSVLLAAALPVAFAFLAIDVMGAWLWLGGQAGLVQMVRNGVASIASFSLTPIPFFVLMGEVLFHTGLAMRAIDAIDRVIGRVPGRLAVVAVVAGTVFSAISGSTIATTALLGSLLLPEMLRRGYHPRMAMGPDHGHRRRRHADPAVRAHRAARQPVRHLDLAAPRRRHRSRRPARGLVRGLHRRRAPASTPGWRLRCP